MTVKQGFLILSAVAVVLLVIWSAFWPPAAWLFVLLLPLVVLGVPDVESLRSDGRRRGSITEGDVGIEFAE